MIIAKACTEFWVVGGASNTARWIHPPTGIRCSQAPGDSYHSLLWGTGSQVEVNIMGLVQKFIGEADPEKGCDLWHQSCVVKYRNICETQQIATDTSNSKNDLPAILTTQLPPSQVIKVAPLHTIITQVECATTFPWTTCNTHLHYFCLANMSYCVLLLINNFCIRCVSISFPCDMFVSVSFPMVCSRFS